MLTLKRVHGLVGAAQNKRNFDSISVIMIMLKIPIQLLYLLCYEKGNICNIY